MTQRVARRARGSLGSERGELSFCAASLGWVSARPSPTPAGGDRRGRRAGARRTHVGGIAGLALTLLVFVLAALVLLVPVRGRTPEQWAPVLVRFAVSRQSGRGRFRSQRAQLGHVVRLPEGELDPRRALEPWSLPGELAGLEFLQGELVQYEHARFGAVVDRRARTFTAALRVRGTAFALLGTGEREERLADYGAVLAALARTRARSGGSRGWSEPSRRTGMSSATTCWKPSARARVWRSRPRSWCPICSWSAVPGMWPRSTSSSSRSRSTPAAPQRDARSPASTAAMAARWRCLRGSSGS